MNLHKQSLSDLQGLIDRYSQEIRAISEEVLNEGQKPSAREFRSKVAAIQVRIHREASEMYDRVVAVSTEVERELLTKLNQIKEAKERAALLREIINSMVKPEAGQ